MPVESTLSVRHDTRRRIKALARACGLTIIEMMDRLSRLDEDVVRELVTGREWTEAERYAQPAITHCGELRQFAGSPVGLTYNQVEAAKEEARRNDFDG